MYPEIYNSNLFQHKQRWNKHSHEESFICKNCGVIVVTQPITSGVQNRNHCPYCLHSRHVDHAQPGDRLSACKAIMQPVGLTIKPGRNKYGDKKLGELMLVHRCSECGKLSINRLAADDLIDRLLEIFYASLGMDVISQQRLISSGIHILHREDWKLVIGQLRGTAEI